MSNLDFGNKECAPQGAYVARSTQHMTTANQSFALFYNWFSTTYFYNNLAIHVYTTFLCVSVSCIMFRTLVPIVFSSITKQ
jgi:hypothetical protein